MNPDLRGQVAIVTGGGRGIGRAIALDLATHGARVAVAARTRGELDAVAAAIAAQGGEALAVPTDLSEEASIAALFATVDAHWGRLDVLVANAGIGRFAAFADITADDLETSLQVNVAGTAYCCREALARMRVRRAGYIITIASITGLKGYVRQAVYGATKHAVMGLTKTLAAEAQEHDVRVSAILPGGVATGMVADSRPDLAQARLIRPEDVAQAVRYLLALAPTVAVDQLVLRRWGSTPVF